ncbi:MAG: S-methyl-5-thioribose-1-phosphate isomerase [Lawsonibacter sp.]|nr:S-methyl-5-thioribose-1-phosphate isomerase [Lawsonibacter sp.]
MEAIRWENHTLYLLDQTRLPAEAEWLAYTDPQAVAHAIRTMVVRGAPAIGVAAAYAMVLAARQSAGRPDVDACMVRARELLAASRPTAVNLFWALDRMERCGLACGNDPGRMEEEAIAIHREDVQMNAAMGRAGAELVPEGARILTHCNAGALATGGFGTALGVIRAAHAQGKVSMVYADETRPLLQGARLTAYELVRDRVPVTLICDDMAGALMSQGKVDLVVVGCDRMAANGDFANKIGTYALAVLAHYHNIPFYTALPSSTIDMAIPDGSHIPVEQRDGEEVLGFAGVRTGPLGARTWNPAFDVTPHQLLSGIITERGVLRPPFAAGLSNWFQVL